MIAIAGVFYVMLYLDLYKFLNGDGHVTPVLYYDANDVTYWYFDFNDANLPNACGEVGLAVESDTCQTLNQSFIGNTVLNGSWIIAVLFTICSAMLIICMF